MNDFENNKQDKSILSDESKIEETKSNDLPCENCDLEKQNIISEQDGHNNEIIIKSDPLIQENHTNLINRGFNYIGSLLKPISSYKFEICVGKKQNENEDANPILQVTNGNKRGLLAVFDGMGGAGSTTYQNRQGESHTGAYFASRFVRDVVNDDFKNVEKYQNFNEYLPKLVDKLENNLKNYLFDLKKSESRIKSKLSRELPTTLASLYYSFIDEENCEVHAVWAGDSRIYILDQYDGLQQISEDDTKTTATLDHYLSTNQDAPLSKCISANTKIELNHQCHKIKLPTILLVATDGCYSYMDTPIHFEKMLIENLLKSKNDKEWGEHISRTLEKISSDDFSMSLICLGWNDFSEIKNIFENRLNQINEWIAPINNIVNEVHQIDSVIKINESEKEQTLNKIDQSIAELEEKVYELSLKIDLENRANEQNKSSIIAKLKDDLITEVKHCISQFIDRCMKNIFNKVEEKSRESALKVASYQDIIDAQLKEIEEIKAKRRIASQQFDLKINEDKQKKAAYLHDKEMQSHEVWNSYKQSYMKKMQGDQ